MGTLGRMIAAGLIVYGCFAGMRACQAVRDDAVKETAKLGSALIEMTNEMMMDHPEYFAEYMSKGPSQMANADTITTLAPTHPQRLEYIICLGERVLMPWKSCEYRR